MLESVLLRKKQGISKRNLLNLDPFDLPLGLDGLQAPLSTPGYGVYSKGIETTPYGPDEVLTLSVTGAPATEAQVGGIIQNTGIVIDTTKRYRLSCWVKVVTDLTYPLEAIVYLSIGSVGGYYDLWIDGIYGYEITDGIIGGTGRLTYFPKNQWILCVGYLNAYGTMSPGYIHQGARYYANGNVQASELRDLSFAHYDKSQQAIFRCCLYDAALEGLDVKFFHPRMEVLDAGTPTIAQLLESKQS